MKSGYFLLCFVVAIGGCTGQQIGNNTDAGTNNNNADAGPQLYVQYEKSYETGDITLGDQDIVLIKLDFSHNLGLDVYVHSVFLLTDMPWGDLENIKILRDGQTIWSRNTVSSNGEYVFDPPVIIPPDQTIQLVMVGTPVNGVCRSVSARFDPQQSTITNAQGAPLYVVEGPNSVSPPTPRMILGKILRVSTATPSADLTINPGQEDAPIMWVDFFAGSHLTIDSLLLTLIFSPEFEMYVTDIKLWKQSTVDYVISGPWDIQPGVCMNGSCTFQSFDQFELEQCVPQTLYVTLDPAVNALIGSSVSGNLLMTAISGHFLDGTLLQTVEPAETYMGPDYTVVPSP